MSDVYVSIDLISESEKRKRPSERGRTSLSLQEKGGTYLLVDAAGMGKSTYAKHICLRVFSESAKIPLFLEFSSYQPERSLWDNMRALLCELDFEIDDLLLKRLITTGRLFLVLDGLDEVPPNERSTVCSELAALCERKEDCSALITTRPFEGLPDLYKATRLEFARLTVEQALRLMSFYDAISNANLAESIIAESDRLPKQFLETPLLVGLLYRTYSYNRTISEQASTFYSEIFDALYKGHDLTKSGFQRLKKSGLSIIDFRRALRAFSFLYIAKSLKSLEGESELEERLDDAKPLSAGSDYDSRSLRFDLLEAVPVLYKDGPIIKFTHRTIAEYFAAEHIAGSPDARGILERIIESPELGHFDKSLEFLSEIAPELHSRFVVVPIAKAFIESSESTNAHVLWRTATFRKHWCVSVWPLHEVEEVKEGRKRLAIPAPPWLREDARSYIYVSRLDLRYVICIASKRKRFVPTSARTALAAEFLLSESASAFKLSPESLDSLLSIVGLRVWSRCDDSAAMKHSNDSALQVLAHRLISRDSLWRSLSSDRCLIIDSAKCSETIQASAEKSSASEVLLGELAELSAERTFD